MVTADMVFTESRRGTFADQIQSVMTSPIALRVSFPVSKASWMKEGTNPAHASTSRRLAGEEV